MTGPYETLPSHGIAYDTWSGIVQPMEDEKGFKRIPPTMPNVGINVGPMVGAIAMHVKVGDPVGRSVPAALMLIMSAGIVLLA